MTKVEECLDILTRIGVPRAQLNERSALTLLAVIDVSEKTPWAQARKRIIRIHDILVFIQKSYQKTYAENTRETIRRQTLHQFEQAGIVERNSDDSKRPTNSPNTVYNVTEEALKLVRDYGKPVFEKSVHEFISKKGRLVEKYDKRKLSNQIELKTHQGITIKFSPGKHNELQVRIIQELVSRFCSGAKLVYVGDTAHKLLFQEIELLKTLSIPITQHDKLPDVVLFDSAKNHLFLIEAVTSHGPISPKRQVELEGTLRDCKAVKIYISAFLDFKEFKRHIDNIAWETEVWVACNPDHMIHFNGPKFFDVY
jgi:adenine-specific DNA-methyltransferase